jgi:hypothetical protein
MNILYCDCFSGISGDMLLASLLDAGLPEEYLDARFKMLNLPEYQEIMLEKVRKGALIASQVTLLPKDNESRQQQAELEQPKHRNFTDIKELIECSSLSAYIKETSVKIFKILAEAEAKVHGSSIAEVHFHEVGAFDSILDIVGIAIGLEYFNIQSMFSSPLPLGTGKVMTQHGLLPLPAPATLELMRISHAPITPSTSTLELVTPTGAAVLAALAEFRQPEMTLKHVGTGAGKRDLEWPNVLRIFIGEDTSDMNTHVEIETNIDDMNPQILGHVMAKLFHSGALDVFFTPIYMKKNRPAIKLSVIASKVDEAVLCTLILRETSSLGVRVKLVTRREADREMRIVDTKFGKIPVKLKILEREVIQASPEFDDCVRQAEVHDVEVSVVLQEALSLSLPFLHADR